MVTRTGFDSLVVYWSAPSPAPAIYEVFYQVYVAGMSSSRLSGGTTTYTFLMLTGLSFESHYSIFVVGSAKDGDLVLPSVHSNTVTILIG